MNKMNGNFGLGLIALIIGILWVLKDVSIIPDWFPLWGLFLIILGATLMWSGSKN